MKVFDILLMSCATLMPPIALVWSTLQLSKSPSQSRGLAGVVVGTALSMILVADLANGPRPLSLILLGMSIVVGLLGVADLAAAWVKQGKTE